MTTPDTKSATVSNSAGKTLKVLPVYPESGRGRRRRPKKASAGRWFTWAQGRVADFNGKKIEGSIAVLDFNSGMNWITAIDLGRARDRIFLEPETSNRGEAERKFTFLPVEVPRYYAPAATATAIRSRRRARSDAQIIGGVGKDAGARTFWASCPAKTRPPKKPTRIDRQFAYYDSMSVVPDLAPGAEAAGNLAAFLELAARQIEGQSARL